jgi:hypothetical protein
MASLIPVTTEATTFYFEATDRAPVPGRTAIVEAGAEDTAERAVETAEALTESIRGFCTRVVGSFDELAEAAKPARASIEFGLSVSAEGNVYVVKGSAEANIKITAEWEFAKAP